MLRLKSKSNSQVGMALGFVMVGILVMSIAAAAILFKSKNFRAEAEQDLKKKALIQKARNQIDDLRGVLQQRVSRLLRGQNGGFPQTFAFNRDQGEEVSLTIPILMETGISSGMDPEQAVRVRRNLWWRLLTAENQMTSCPQISPPNTQCEPTLSANWVTENTNSGMLGRLSTMRRFRPEQRESVLLDCEKGCDNDPQNSPKIFSLRYELRSEDGTGSVKVTAKLALAPKRINDIALMVGNQRSIDGFNFVSGGQRDGKFMVFFDDPVATVTGQPNNRVASIRFLNREPLTFARELVTNLPSVDDFEFGYIPNAGNAFVNEQVNFEKGVVLGAPNPKEAIRTRFNDLAVAPSTQKYTEPAGTGPILVGLGRNSLTGATKIRITKQKNYMTSGGVTQIIDSIQATRDIADNEAIYIDASQVRIVPFEMNHVVGNHSAPPAANQTQVTLGKTNFTLMARDQMTLSTSIQRFPDNSGNSQLQPTEGNIALVSINNKVALEPNGRSKTGSTFVELRNSGVSGAYSGTNGLPTFAMEASIVSLSPGGKFEIPAALTCTPGGVPAGTNCRPLGNAKTYGSMLVDELSPWNYATNQGVIQGGFSRVSANFNDGILKDGGTPPGFEAEDVTAMQAHYLGNIQVEYSDMNEAVAFFE